MRRTPPCCVSRPNGCMAWCPSGSERRASWRRELNGTELSGDPRRDDPKFRGSRCDWARSVRCRPSGETCAQVAAIQQRSTEAQRVLERVHWQRREAGRHLRTLFPRVQFPGRPRGGRIAGGPASLAGRCRWRAGCAARCTTPSAAGTGRATPPSHRGVRRAAAGREFAGPNRTGRRVVTGAPGRRERASNDAARPLAHHGDASISGALMPNSATIKITPKTKPSRQKSLPGMKPAP